MGFVQRLMLSFSRFGLSKPVAQERGADEPCSRWQLRRTWQAHARMNRTPYKVPRKSKPRGQVDDDTHTHT